MGRLSGNEGYCAGESTDRHARATIGEIAFHEVDKYLKRIPEVIRGTEDIGETSKQAINNFCHKDKNR